MEALYGSDWRTDLEDKEVKDAAEKEGEDGEEEEEELIPEVPAAASGAGSGAPFVPGGLGLLRGTRPEVPVAEERRGLETAPPSEAPSKTSDAGNPAEIVRAQLMLPYDPAKEELKAYEARIQRGAAALELLSAPLAEEEPKSNVSPVFPGTRLTISSKEI